ncbi:MAG: tRNA (guanosine(46)-N7)-methyltransferase TrmB [Frankiales bacterium]|nr:MAG: tRNA (guanosine(46)-N7)-methyltransferase TrmB [Frankiales bacterium]
MTAPVRTFKVRRRVTPGQADALARLLPGYGVDATRPFVAAQAFGRQAPLVLEIGSGMGEATAAMAAADPGRDVLAVEVHTPGLGTLLRRIEDAGLTNVRVLEGDAREVLADLLAPGSLDEVRVFFPDPWPKARHAKRRLVTAGFAALVASRLRPGGRLHVATDWTSYAEQVEQVLAGSEEYDVVARDRGARPVTRFEQRGLDAGRQPHDVVARRR